MKKTLIATALIALLGTSAVMAATADAEAAKQRVQELKTEFSLDDQQVNSIQNIITRSSVTDEAQRAQHMEQRMEKRLSRMKEQLSLSDEQVTQLKAMMTAQRTKMQAMQAEGKASMESILTPEQVTKMQAMQGDRKGRMGGWGGGKRHGGGQRDGRNHDRGQCGDKQAQE